MRGIVPPGLALPRGGAEANWLKSASLFAAGIPLVTISGLDSPTSLRLGLAQSIAGYIVHDLMPWQNAREKAFEDLGRLPADAVPSAAEIESAVRETWAVFAPDAHAALLRSRREAALRLMTDVFAGFDVTLTGAVLNGAATPESNIRLELFTDDVKEAEVALMDRGIDFDVLDTIDSRMPAPLEVLAFIDPESDRRDPAGVFVEVHSPKHRGRNPYRGTADAWQEAWEAAGRVTASELQKHLA